MKMKRSMMFTKEGRGFFTKGTVKVTCAPMEKEQVDLQTWIQMHPYTDACRKNDGSCEYARDARFLTKLDQIKY